MEKISQDKLWAIYETLPSELKDSIFSEDTADAIWNICKLHDVDKTSIVAKLVGRVLMGLLPPEMFMETLEDEMSLSEDIAKKIGMEIEHFIFNPIKNKLDTLYEKEGTPKEDVTKREPESPEKADTYRELV
jgi:hypothetical protein